MNLRERLRALRSGAGARPTPMVAGSPGGAGATGNGPAGDGPGTNIDFGPDIELTKVATTAGSVLCAERRYDLTFKQGCVPLDAPLHVPERGWRRLLPFAAEPFPIHKALFVDLETTGLSRGTGTYAFLIGVGRFTEDGFRLRQFFLRDYGDELAVLEALRTELAQAEALVTFNGRSFDWPLLETRATMNRLRLPRLPHLDILHPARRAWRSVLGGCSLVQLETGVLGLTREGDIPGHLIPGRYFDYLQTGDASPLADVLIHNRLDILSMTALAGHLGQAVAAPRQFAVQDEPLSGPELFAFGRWLLPEVEGIACLEEALQRGLPPGPWRECARLLAIEYKRAQRYDEAMQLWHRLVAQDGLSPWAHVELAKHYEHRLRDLTEARRWTLRAIELVRRRRALRSGSPSRFDNGKGGGGPELEELLHRLGRLEDKLGRRKERTGA